MKKENLQFVLEHLELIIEKIIKVELKEACVNLGCLTQYFYTLNEEYQSEQDESEENKEEIKKSSLKDNPYIESMIDALIKMAEDLQHKPVS